MENLYLIAGVGNPGRKYARTRHNIGFRLVAQLASRWRGAWAPDRKFRSDFVRLERDGRQIILCQPQTFMNASGVAVAAFRRFYRVPPTQMLVVVDDADLPLGHIRLKAGGSSGGHHGLESVEAQLGTREYPRLRIGIGRREEDGRQISDYVLGQFAAVERPVVDEVLDRACRQVECWLDAGIMQAMNHFNGAVPAPLPKGKQ
jgi:PTH1 family peptidyl-tRNA hydrolase